MEIIYQIAPPPRAWPMLWSRALKREHPMTLRKPAPLAAGLLLTLSAGCHRDAAPSPESLARAACRYGPGDPAEKTLADTWSGSKIPIDHFVMVMQENRTFDHYFSSLTVPGQTVDGALADAGNPDPRSTTPGQTLSRFHQPSYCFDNPAEEWAQVHAEVDDGGMDGFTAQNAASDPVNDPAGLRAMGYYDESDLPFYYALARAFAISDRHFAAVLANTFPNRLYYMAGTSYGVVDDSVPSTTDPAGQPYPNLFTELDAAGVDWRFYADSNPTLLILLATYLQDESHVQPVSQFYVDADAGTLPPVSFVEGVDGLGGASPNEDPPADPQVGQAMVAQIVRAVMASPQWPSTAMFFTYDEQGGFYDHVPPRPACAPDDIAPKSGSSLGGFGETGLRVPLIAISPYAKRGYVSHVPTEHTGLLRMLEARFDLPAMTRRDANAEPPFDLFDFEHPDLQIPALPAADIDMDKLSECQLAFPPQGATRR